MGVGARSLHVSQQVVWMLFFLLGSCGSYNNNQTRVQTKIDEKAKLLLGERRFSEYSRYYSWDSPYRVTSVFIVQDPGQRHAVAQFCRSKGLKVYPCNQSDFGIIGRGSAKWVPDQNGLPSQSGGSCSYILASYDTVADRFISFRCAGPY